MASVRGLKRCVVVAVLWWCGTGARALAQDTGFVGAAAGVSTLSTDGASRTTEDSIGVSLYAPENGLLLHVFGGVHVTDYLSVQGNYSWQQNDLTLVSHTSAMDESAFYEQRRNSVQHAVSADLLLYFRDRRSWARPYLSAGLGVVHFTSRADVIVVSRGAPRLPPLEFSSRSPALKVAVGIDLTLGRAWSFRYSFSETLRQNPVSRQLSPQGVRSLANFQSVFGAVKRF